MFIGTVINIRAAIYLVTNMQKIKRQKGDIVTTGVENVRITVYKAYRS